MTIRIRPRAVGELDDLTEQIARSRPTVTERFRRAVEQACTDLERMPGMGAPCQLSNPRLQDVRSWVVKGFRNHLIYYRPIDGGVEVLHVFHARQDATAILEAETD